MPLQKLLSQPGVTTLATPTLNEQGWAMSNLIRWRDGFLEKLMGWRRLFNDAVSGRGRTLHPWQDLDFIKYLAIGTNTELAIWSLGYGLQQITPISATANLTNPLSTTDTSTTIGVADVAHGTTEGDWIYIVMPTSIGGLILQGDYVVTNVIDADNYEFEAASAATATVAAGGDVPMFTTVNTSTTVTVTLPDHGYSGGELFYVEISTSVGGLTLTGEYVVDTVIDPDNFTIESVLAATSNDAVSENGGDVRILYRLPIGNESSELLTGYGTGPYGSGTYGMSASVQVEDPLRYWALDNFGEYLIASPTGGALYVWIPPQAPTNFATVVATAPTMMNGMFVAMPQAQVVALGAEVAGVQDPLLVRYSDTGSYSDFTATEFNQAGSFRLSRGSKIVGGAQGALGAWIWTDLDLWQMVYQGPPFIYGFDIVGVNCGLIAPYAYATLGADVYWMSTQGFYTAGTTTPNPLACPVWDRVFGDLDLDNADKCIAASNSSLGEVTWYFPVTGGNGEPSRYVKLNINTGLWDYGTLVRTGWTDESVLGNPLGVDDNGRIQQHELGYDDDTVAMTGVTARTGYLDLGDGTEYSFVDWVIPDFAWNGTDPELEMKVYTLEYPGGTPIEHGPFTVDSSTELINLRARARQIAFEYTMDGEDMWFRLGAVRARLSPAGRR